MQVLATLSLFAPVLHASLHQMVTKQINELIRTLARLLDVAAACAADAGSSQLDVLQRKIFDLEYLEVIAIIVASELQANYF